MPLLDELAKQAAKDGFQGIILDASIEKSDFSLATVGRDYTKSSVFALGSISKLFTQMAIMQLVEKDKIALDSPVSLYLKSTQIPDAWKTWIHHVKVGDLISHHSGLPSTLYPSEEVGALFHHLKEAGSVTSHFFMAENAQFDKALLEENLKQSDDEGEYYSNIGYNLLAIIIENASGKTYPDYLTDHIFHPAGMSHSFSGTDNSASLFQLIAEHSELDVLIPQKFFVDLNHIQSMDDQEVTYKVAIDPHKKMPSEDYNFAFGYGAGSVFSSSHDLALWLRALFDKKVFFEKESTMKAFIALSEEENNIWGHQGELPGFHHMLLVDLKTKKRVIVLSNLNHDMKFVHDEVVRLKGKNIKQLKRRGGVEGTIRELEVALSKAECLSPLSIALHLIKQPTLTPKEREIGFFGKGDSDDDGKNPGAASQTPPAGLNKNE